MSDCRKVDFDETHDRKLRYRLVYRLCPDEITAVEVQAILVGMRAAVQVCVDAARRRRRCIVVQPNDAAHLQRHRPGTALRGAQ